MIALTVVLAVLVGISLGVLGGGGSILTVPLLAYVAGMDAKQAIATSLLVVGVTSAFGAISHARSGNVQWRTGLVFGVAGMAGAYTGGILAQFIPGTVLLIGFALIMIATAVAMLRGRRNGSEAQASQPLPVVKILFEGLIVGLVTGLLGAGGGFLIVPALALLGGLPMPAAVGTSLVVIAMNALAGFAGHLPSVDIDWQLTVAVTAAAVVGGLIGARVTSLLNPATLRKAFGWFVLAMSSVILAQEVHPVVGIAAAASTVLAAGFTVACNRYAHCPLRRLAARQRLAALAT